MTCFFCKGNMEEALTTFTVDCNGVVVVVRNVPCYKCTQCGEESFSDDVAKRLEEIVNKAKTSVTEIALIDYKKVA